MRRASRTVTVRGHDRSLAVLQKPPCKLLGAWSMQAEQARSVHLESPPASRQLHGDFGVVEDGLGALRMSDHRSEPTVPDVLGHLKEDVWPPGEWDLDEHTAGAFELVSTHVLTQKPGMWRQLEPEPQLQPCVRAHLPVSLAGGDLALVSERQVRPDMRRGEKDRRAVRSCLAAELDALAHGRSAVITGRDDMRVAVNEEG